VEEMSMQAFRIETKVQEDGSLMVKDLPFVSGEMVEVIILPQQPSVSQHKAYPLRGTKVIYHDPFKPVAESDWEAAE
jgi:hypothetical protein